MARRHPVALLSAAVLWVPAPGAAIAAEEDARCDGRTQSRLQREVDDAMRFRRGFDLPRTRRYVLRVLTNPRYERSADWYGTPLTPPELRYMKKRERVSARAGAVAAEARRLADDAFAGVSVEDDYPAGAYVAVRFTRDHESLGAEIARNVAVRLRPLPAEFSADRLESVRDELGRRLVDPRERGELEREGFDVRSWGVDISDNRVVVGVISARTDVEESFRSRFGPEVLAHVIATAPFEIVCIAAEAYRASTDGRTLKLHYFTNSVYRFERMDLVETDRAVRVAVWERAPNGPVTSAGESRVVTVKLRRPLGDRRVVDAESGRTLPRLRRTALRR